jgi:hypothetical protein
MLSDLKSLQPYVIGFPIFHGLLVGCCCVVRSAISTKRSGGRDGCLDFGTLEKPFLNLGIDES